MLDASLLTGSPLSITNDIIISIVLGVLITGYILHSGVEKIVLVALSLYIAVTLNQFIFFSVSSVGPVSGNFLILILLFIGTFFVLNRSSVGKGLSYSKKAKGRNILFGVATVGFLLTTIIPYLSLLNTPYSQFLRQSLFGQELFQLLWSLAPIVLLPILIIPKKR